MTILLIEDNPADVEMIRELLSDNKGLSFDIINADRLSAAKPHFSDKKIEIIILDLGLPDSQGLDTLRRVREQAGEVPIVVMTMLDNEATGLDSLKEGAQDYLVKGQMNGPLIARSLRYAIERGRIEKELRRHRDSLEERVEERTSQLAASLDEKIILLREVHHRVKNNLQIIISLVSLQMRQTEDPAVKQIMSETQNRVRAMSLVHEKLYRSDSLCQIDFADYTRFLANQLFSFYGMDTRRVQLDFAMEKIPLDINTAVPLGLLMNELISNSLKHAFPDGREGVISISGGYKGNLITLVVRDDGIGIPKELDWKSTTSLGMQLVTSLVDQVDGTITLDRENGTLFTITVNGASHQEEPDDMHIRANRD